MDIKYYINYDSGSVEAINMDNVKRIYIEHFNDINNNLGKLYFDDVNVHIIKRGLVEDKINEIVNSEEKILEMYNSDIFKTKLNEENKNKVFMNGYSSFKEFIESKDVNIEGFISIFKIIGIRPYIELLKDKNRIGNDETNDYIVRFILIFMYLKHIKEI